MISLNLVECTGCGACVNACSENAIFMYKNNKGFLYPEINPDICVECGMCVRSCPLEKSEDKKENEIRNVYAMQSGDSDVRWNSTSGGAFSELAKIILRKGGIVVGAIYDSDWFVKHHMIYDEKDLELLRRSKYQQSEIGEIYQRIKGQLIQGKEVLFCGTPCQGAGLKGFLNEEYDNLYICDFICRGVCSPLLFQEYLKDLEYQYKSEVISVWMKNKRLGWHNLTTEICFANGEEYLCKGKEDSYLRMFLFHNIGVRDSCYTCHFKGKNSVADITLGDFWGIEHLPIDDNKGTSVLISHSLKGQNLIEGIKEDNFIQPMSINDVLRGNPCLNYPLKKIETNDELFFDVLNKEGYRAAYESLEVLTDEQIQRKNGL